MPHFVYTVAFDAPGSENYRFLAKMLAPSLVRTYFPGDVVVFRNSPAPLFQVERKGLHEVFVPTPPMGGQAAAQRAWCWKYRAAEMIENPEQYDKILFLDCDSLALRHLGDLLEGDWDIRYQPERGERLDSRKFNAFLTDEEMLLARHREGANSGTIAVRGSRFHEVMRRWREIDEGEPVRASGFRDQASWNALLLREQEKGKDFRVQGSEVEGGGWAEGVGEVGLGGVRVLETGAMGAGALAPGGTPGGTGGTPVLPGLRIEPFPVGEVQFPGYLDPMYQSYSKAALTHNILPDTKEKIEFTFGLYMRTFFCDPTGLFFSMLEM